MAVEPREALPWPAPGLDVEGEAHPSGLRVLDRDLGEGSPASVILERPDHLVALLLAKVHGRSRVEHDCEGVEGALGKKRGQDLDEVPFHEPWRIGTCDLDRRPHPFESAGLIGPHEGLEDAGAVIRRDVAWAPVDAGSATALHPACEEVRGWPACSVAGQLEAGVCAPPGRVSVPVAIAIPEEVQTRAGAELDEIERSAVGHREKA